MKGLLLTGITTKDPTLIRTEAALGIKGFLPTEITTKDSTLITGLKLRE
jgi:hypothetical protein